MAVTIGYTLKDDAGKVIDTSEGEGRQPLTYLHGVGALVPGLEKALAGKQAGDTLTVDLSSAEAYGDRDETLIRNIPLRKLGEKKPTVGGRYRVQTDKGVVAALVIAVDGDYAKVDLNHPLAGMNLHFQVNVVSVRAATDEEIAHGHVHAPGGHHHG
ncbi:MAG TPA: peptidylprolyl isomerase [Polyangia bacterium]|nr:peptidylprolyl isomerase [Polyangia bacterium]